MSPQWDPLGTSLISCVGHDCNQNCLYGTAASSRLASDLLAQVDHAKKVWLNVISTRNYMRWRSYYDGNIGENPVPNKKQNKRKEYIVVWIG